MKKFILGVFVGIGISTFAFVPILSSARHDNPGRITGRYEAANALEKEFGRYDGQTPYKVLFSVKTTDVISTETNGVRTVRVIP